jgi:drug/metabolite transporter (DMT)-like permease
VTFENRPYVYVLISVLLWGSTPAVGKILLENINSLQLLLYTSFSASLSLMAISIYQGKLDVLRSYKIQDYAHFAWMGFIGVFLYYVSLFAALMFTSAQKAFILNYTWPIWTVIFGVVILNEELGFKKILGITLSFLGVLVVISEGQISQISLGDPRGIIFAILGAVFYGLFSVLGKKYDYERFSSMSMYYGFAFLYTAISAPIITDIVFLSLPQLIGAFWLGVFSSGLGFLCWFLALKHGETAKMSNYIFLTPFVSLVYIYFFVGEEILATSFIGLSVIVLGIIVQKRND